MKITFKRTNGEHVVTVNGRSYTFATNKEAWEFIFKLQKAA